ncbi:MAG TPA: DUF4129 domain-containing protein [Jiangellales bacterium]|nr:DUF4129 domain-containing protein [Jiangellales bacterium]
MSLPVDLDRDEARDLAERELANPRYDSDPPLVQQFFEWIIRQINELLAAAGGTLNTPWGLVLLGLIVAVVAIIFLRYGPPARRRRSQADAVFGASRRSAREYRAAADAAAEDSRWAEAVVERFRAIIADLEERGLLDVKPGMTADEAAREAGRALPDLATDLPPAAALFDAVYYGGHEATGDDDRRLRALDAAVREHSRPRLPQGSQP